MVSPVFSMRFESQRDNLKKGDLVYAEAEIEITSYEKNGETIYGVSTIANQVSVAPTECIGN
jgi:single-stranded DNA-binding protein